MNDTIFPSTEWFRALARCMQQDEAAYRTLGPVDCTMVVVVDRPAGPACYEIAFADFGVRAVRELASPADAAPGHFVLEASLETWREMIDNIRAHGGPDLTHTLNYLTFPEFPMRVSGADQLEVDTFYRYHESLQRFFNGAAGVPTAYAA